MTTATATNKVTWAKVARKTLRISWWVVLFVTKLVIFVGLLILKFFEDRNTQHVKDVSDDDLHDAGNMNNYVNPISPLCDDKNN